MLLVMNMGVARGHMSYANTPANKLTFFYIPTEQLQKFVVSFHFAKTSRLTENDDVISPLFRQGLYLFCTGPAPRHLLGLALISPVSIACRCAVLSEIDFLLKFAIYSLLVSYVESSYLKTDMCKFESSQKDESRA